MEQIKREFRLVAVRNEIATRIKRVCGDLTPDQFDELLDRMTLMRYKYECLYGLPRSTQIDDSNSEGFELRR